MYNIYLVYFLRETIPCFCNVYFRFELKLPRAPLPTVKSSCRLVQFNY